MNLILLIVVVEQISIGEPEVVGSIGWIDVPIIGIVISFDVVVVSLKSLDDVSKIYLLGISFGGVGGLTEELSVLNIADLLDEVSFVWFGCPDVLGIASCWKLLDSSFSLEISFSCSEELVCGMTHVIPLWTGDLSLSLSSVSSVSDMNLLNRPFLNDIMLTICQVCLKVV